MAISANPLASMPYQASPLPGIQPGAAMPPMVASALGMPQAGGMLPGNMLQGSGGPAVAGGFPMTGTSSFGMTGQPFAGQVSLGQPAMVDGSTAALLGLFQMMQQMISAMMGALLQSAGPQNANSGIGQPPASQIPVSLSANPGSGAPVAASTPPQAVGGSNGYELAVLEEVNRFRAQNGLPPVRLNQTLNQAAQKHSDYQAANRRMSHDGAGGSQVSDRVSAAGYRWRSVNENVAWNQQTPQEVVQAWINSPGHRANLLSASVKEIGVGENNKYWTLNMAG
jgi:uncharacterized protein YkwD